jgi:fructose-1-phosphate kinase PfkB-like protein
VRQASRRSWRIGQKEPVNVHHLYYNGTIQEKAITLNVKKLRAALLTEGELTDGQFLEQIEEDGLVALAKTIIDRAEEKISLESELRKLRGVEEETDMILPRNLELEEVVDEDLVETADESPRSEETQVEGTKELVVPIESRQEPMQKRSGTRSQSPTQLLLFAYVS